MNSKDKIEAVLSELNIKAPTFASKIELKYQRILDIQNGRTQKISGEVANAIVTKYPQFNINWLLTGEGKMLKGGAAENNTERGAATGKLIPFYDDVSTIGGVNEQSANLESASQPTDYIDTGDWFRDATAAIRHYGESMVEYPPGCILALKEVQDRELIVPGRDYVIETSEYRVTKRIQRGKDSDHITAYSTNPETYADGRLIHEPFDIPWRAVTRISSVLGYVVKTNGGTMVFSNQKTK